MKNTISIAEDMNFSSGMGAFEAKHFGRAMELLHPIAEAGNSDAQHRVAIMLQNGLGVTSDAAGAARWMRAAAEQRHPLAQHGLGFMYLEGECLTQDEKEAVNWFRKAADQGLAGSQTTLAMMYAEGRGVEKDPEQARNWYLLAGFDDQELTDSK